MYTVNHDISRLNRLSIPNAPPPHLTPIRLRNTMSSPSDTPPASPGSDYIAPEDPILSPGQGWHPSQRPSQSFQTKRKKHRYIVCGIVGVTVIVVGATLLSLRDRIYVASLRRDGVPPGLWSDKGVLYAGRERFDIKGLSWYGMEEEAKVFGGMKDLAVEDVLQFMGRHNFNAVRIPLAVDNILENGFPVEGISVFKNSQLMGKSYLNLLQLVIHKAAAHNILVLLDMHRLKNYETPSKSNGLWHSVEVPEEKVFSAWKILCQRFKDEWNIIGADLFNEPHQATWGTNNATGDWKIASERMSELIHENCPSWLIAIQGIANENGGLKQSAFWGENLRVMHDKPPKVTLSKKVSLSPHSYGPATFEQEYFKKDDFVKDMPAIWDEHFGLASGATGFATVVGEWGGRYTGKDRAWQQRFVQYLIDKKMGSFYWCLNPESEDTGGLLQEGWSPPENEKLLLLEGLPSSKVEDHAIHFKHWRDWRTQ